MNREVLGSFIQIASSLIGITGVTLQRLAFIQDSEELAHTSRVFNKRWALGFSLLYLSQIVEMLALAFASQTTIVAVSACGIFINPLVAVYFFHEPFHFLPPKRFKSHVGKLFRWDLLNLGITVMGSVCTLIYAPNTPQSELDLLSSHDLFMMWTREPFGYFFLICVLLVPGLLWHFFRWQEEEKKKPLALTVALSICQAFSMTLTKVMTLLLANKQNLGDWKVLVMILIWIALLVLQIYLFQQGLQRFEQSGTFSMCGMLGGALTITSGMLYYQTYRDMQHKMEFAIGIAFMFYGVLAFSQRHVLSQEEMKQRLKLEEPLTEDEEELMEDELDQDHRTLFPPHVRTSLLEAA
ncbi:hypothetical protein BASA81_006825 [Batrachochytrium salamandrivorans]|nr:hypothetical protein BASA81_006825 [Batrachochytrium salamandrivorans]